MTKILTPESDLLFKANAQVKNTDHEIGNHLQKEDSSLDDIGTHICGRKKIMREKIELMGKAILDEDWIEFDKLYYDVKSLDLSNSVLTQNLNVFGKNQLKDTISRNCSVAEIETLKRKLKSIGINEDFIDDGYDEGYNLLKNNTNY